MTSCIILRAVTGSRRGYVDQPPFSIAVLAVVRTILGDSLHVIRFLPAVAGSCVVVLAALMRGGSAAVRFAQGCAALAVVCAPGLLSHGGYFSMNSFDVLFWATAAYLVVIILGEDKPKLWLLFGVVIGLGLLNKYSIGFLCIGLAAGLLVTPQRKQLFTKWFWFGALAAFVIFLPHIIWEISERIAEHRVHAQRRARSKMSIFPHWNSSAARSAT